MKYKNPYNIRDLDSYVKRQIRFSDKEDFEIEPGVHEMLVDTLSEGAHGIYQPVEIARALNITIER